MAARRAKTAGLILRSAKRLNGCIQTGSCYTVSITMNFGGE